MPTLNDILTANGDYTPVSGYPVDDKYENDSPVINVYDRTIGEIVGDTSTSGENVSQYLTFRIPRHPDHYDLIENGTNIRILYRLEDDTGEDVVPVNVVANEDYIIFGWKIPLVVTVNPGVVTFIIHAYKSENNLITYHYKTLPKTYRILETMETDVVVPEIEMYNLAEAYARGTITDVFGHTRPVEEGEPGYHDNSKYYKELAGTSKIDAETAKNAAEAAQGAAETAQQAAENARDQAVAIVGGEYVSYGQTQSLNDTQKNKARENIGATGPNGYYPNMTVGLSENFVGTGEPTRRIFNYDTAGGSADISDGNAEIDKIVGDTVAWNQMIPDSNRNYTNTSETDTRSYFQFMIQEAVSPYTKYVSQRFYTAIGEYSVLFKPSSSATGVLFKHDGASTNLVMYRGSNLPLTANHVYMFAADFKSVDVTTIGGVVVQNLQFFDLTQMFGSTIADYIYSLEQSQAGAGVAWFKKLFPLDYYPYDEGTLLNVNPAGIKTVGFNAYDKTTGKAELIGGNQYQITGTYTSLSYSTGEVLTPDSTDCFTPTKTGELTVTGGGENTCVHLTWSGYRNGDYEDYWTRTRDINIQPYFPDGLKRAGTVYDEISKDKAIKRIGIVDLGTLTWTYDSTYAVFTASVNTYTSFPTPGPNNMGVCSKYLVHGSVVASELANYDDTIFICPYNWSSSKWLLVRDTSYTDATAFKTAMSGVMLYYELAEPVETQIDPPLNLLYQVSDFGTEQFLGAGATEPKTLPIIADIVYDVNYRDTIKNLPKNYAKVRGYYPDLYTGLADNLIDRKGNGTPQEISYRTSCGDDSITDDGNGIIQSIFGNTVVWNQLFNNYGNTRTIYNVLLTPHGNSIDAVGTVSGSTSFLALTTNFTFKRDGRKYLVRTNKDIGSWGINGYTLHTTTGFIFSQNEGTDWNYGSLGISVTDGAEVSLNNISFEIFDLTQMFGAGNEPSTLDDPRIKWIKDYANEYPEYNIGELISYNGSGIKTVGFNQWDEEWEVGIFDNNGEPYGAATNAIRSKTFCKCVPNTAYYCRSSKTGSEYYIQMFYYDANKNFISRAYENNRTFTTPQNAHYFKICTQTSSYIYGGTYLNDICINLSWSGYRNGEYEPYWSRMLNLPISTYFPDGMKSAGSVRDELTKDKAVKRIGVFTPTTATLEANAHYSNLLGVPCWDFNMPSDMKGYNSWDDKNAIADKIVVRGYAKDVTNCIITDAAKSLFVYASSTGVTAEQATDFIRSLTFVYELAEPIETTITPPLDLTYKVADFGTEESITEGKSTPFIGIIKYSDDFIRGLVNMPKNYDTTASLDALAASLSAMLTSALDGTVTITRGVYDPATKKYEWSCQFTKNQVN